MSGRQKEVPALYGQYDDEGNPLWMDGAVRQLLALRAALKKAREEQAQIDSALETWFYPGEFDDRVKAVQETARIWDGIVAALDIGDSDVNVVKTIQDMVEYAGVINAVNAQLTAESDSARAMLREALSGLLAALEDMHFLGETVTARVSLWMSNARRALKGKGDGL